MVEEFGLFKSGIGIHYSDSAIVNSQHQMVAKNLTVGKRFPPEFVICARDDRLVQIHDLLQSNTMFKLFVFTGDLADEAQKKTVQTLADRLSASPLLQRHKLANDDSSEPIRMMEIHSVMVGKRGYANYLYVPAALRAHWTK